MERLVQIGSGHTLGVAASYVAALVALGVVLSYRVIAVRRAQKIGIGDGDDRNLLRRIRAHGNFSEYAPVLMIIVIMLALLGAREWLVHLIGMGGLVGRILHALGLSRTSGASVPRVAGMILTHAALFAGAVALVTLAWF